MADRLAVERSVAGLRELVSGWRAAGRSVGLVPTMGALHDGHMALVNAARDDCEARRGGGGRGLLA
jgi:pantoate--beta-alanine ligase